MAKTTLEKIAEQKTKMEQMENELKRLTQQHKAEERKARTNRLCKRHGLFESLLPDTIPLTEGNFKLFLEKTVANDFGRRALAALTAEQRKEAAAESADTAAGDGGASMSAIAANTANNGNATASADAAKSANASSPTADAKPADPVPGNGAAPGVRAPETKKPAV